MSETTEPDKEYREWLRNACQWGIEGPLQQVNERWRLMKEWQEACVAYGVEIGKRMAQGDWGNGVEEKKLDDMRTAFLRDIQTQIAAAIRTYPEHHKRMLEEALASANKADLRLEKIHDLT